MDKKLYIHIGSPKTATTTIQNFLFEQKEFLHEHGYHYMETGLNEKLKCHHDLIWGLGLHKAPPYALKNVKKNHNLLINLIKEEIEKYKNKHFIISSELLFFIQNFKEINKITDNFIEDKRKIIFIVSLRRQDTFFESLYQQIIKDGETVDFEQWMKRAKILGNYNMLLGRIMDISERKNIRINIFDSRKENFNPVKEHLVMLDIQEDIIKSLDVENVKENQSLSLEQVEKLRAFNRSKGNNRYQLIQSFYEENRANKENRAVFFDEIKRDDIIKMYVESNLNLVKRMNIPSKEAKYLFY